MPGTQKQSRQSGINERDQYHHIHFFIKNIQKHQKYVHEKSCISRTKGWKEGKKKRSNVLCQQILIFSASYVLERVLEIKSKCCHCSPALNAFAGEISMTV